MLKSCQTELQLYIEILKNGNIDFKVKNKIKKYN